VLPGDGRFTTVQVPARGAARRSSSNALDLTVRGICRECNHWFGANVEEPARPILAMMIRGEPRALDAGEQFLIATWTAKTAAMAELTFAADQRLMGGAALSAIRRERCAPWAVDIWAGAVVESFETVILQQIGPSRITLPSGAEHEGADWFQTFRLGRLALQIGGHTFPTRHRVGTDNDETGAALRIWPIRYPTITWPPPRTLTDAEFVELTRVPTAHLFEPDR
jgi:hypothetical protein